MKQGEAALEAQLGYETARGTPGQARTATSAVQHGTTTVLFRFHARHGAFYRNLLSSCASHLS
jgi:hypothetical protein